MNEESSLKIGNIPYAVFQSARARSMRITIHRNGEVKVTVPYGFPRFLVSRFVSKKQKWISDKVTHFLKHPVIEGNSLLRSRSRRDFLAHKKEARELVVARIEHFNRHYDFAYKKITIRNQKSRWGSCSHKGNINFNYKIVYLPPELQDYIVVHELCHLKQMNHSRAFWDLVGEQVSDHKELRKMLKGI
jgi:predicted metal-dependent hydrolase